MHEWAINGLLHVQQNSYHIGRRCESKCNGQWHASQQQDISIAQEFKQKNMNQKWYFFIPEGNDYNFSIVLRENVFNLGFIVNEQIDA